MHFFKSLELGKLENPNIPTLRTAEGGDYRLMGSETMVTVPPKKFHNIMESGFRIQVMDPVFHKHSETSTQGLPLIRK